MCGLLDVGCHISQTLSGIWWLPYAVWGVLGVLILVALAKVKELTGWPGVFAVLTLGAYGYGYLRGRKGESVNPLQHDLPFPDGLPTQTRPKQKPKVPVKKRPKTLADLFNQSKE